MSKSDKKREQIIAAVAAHLLQDGFRNSGLRALARAAGSSDRMLMYYFDTKEQIVAEAMMLSAIQLAEQLEISLPGTDYSSEQILAVMRDAGDSVSVQQVLRLWFEIVGLSMRGQEPYQSTARLIIDNWHEWLRNKLSHAERSNSEDLLAHLEGHLMLKLLSQ